MDLISTRTSGWLLVVGFIMLVAGAAVAPSGAYDGEISARQQVINSKAGQWRLSKVFDGLAAVLPPVSFLMLAVLRSRQGSSMTSMAGGVVFVIAGIIGAVYVYRLATDPLPFYDRSSPAPISLALYVSYAAGLLLFGISFLPAELPRWISLSMIAISALALILVVLIRGANPILHTGPEIGFGIAVVLYLVTLAVGIALIRSP